MARMCHPYSIPDGRMRINTVLNLGIKGYPHNTALQSTSLVGQRGGGTNKYTSTLFRNLPEDVSIVAAVQHFDGQLRTELDSDITVYRYWATGNRAVRQILTNIQSFLHGFVLVERHNVDVIHGHMQIGILFAWLLGRLTGRPVVGTPYSVVTATEGSSLYTGILAAIEKWVYPRVDSLVFESGENRAVAISERGFEDLANDRVILTGIEVPPHASIPEPLGNRTLRLFYIGRVVPVKALDQLLLGMAGLPSDIRNRVRLDIIGEGEMMPELKRIQMEHQLTDVVHLHGFVEDTSPFYAEADVFVLPSHQEGLSVSLLEAMSHGKACLINDFGVPFEPGDVLIMPDNMPETISHHVTELLEHPERIQALAISARTRIEERFSVEAFARQYADLYRGLAS